MPRIIKKLNSIRERLTIGPWYAEGFAVEVAKTVLREPEHFDDLLECLLDPDKGISKRASYALMLVSERRSDLFQPYKDVLFDEIGGQEKWFVRYRLCTILTRLRLNNRDIKRAAELFEAMLEEPRIALCAAALQGLVALALLDPERQEETVWLIEMKMQSGGPAMRARGRMLLRRLHRGDRRFRIPAFQPNGRTPDLATEFRDSRKLE